MPPLRVVRSVLETYAERGVFRSFSQVASSEFQFHWLWNHPFRMTFDEQRASLTFSRLLPGIPAGSDIDAGLRAFVQSCQSPERPEHRRIDPARVAVRYTNRRGCASIRFRVTGGDYEYGTRKAIHLVNEMFVSFLGAGH